MPNYLVAPVHETFPEDQILAVTIGLRIFMDTIYNQLHSMRCS